MDAIPIAYGRLETRVRPQPHEMNNHGAMHGGMLMYHLDMACGMTAMRHAGTRVVTVSVDRMDFKSPVRPGENLLYKTCVNMVHRSSIEVGARIEAENPYTAELRHAGTAYLTFVALGDNGRPIPVRGLIPETDDDRRRMADAVRRAYLRRMERDQSKGKALSFALQLSAEPFVVCRADPGAEFPFPTGTNFAFRAGTPRESTFVLPASDKAVAALAALPGARLEKGWRGFVLQDDLDLSVSGIVASLSAVLAAEKIPLLYVSTFASACLLVRGDTVEAAAQALRLAGHMFTRPD